MKKIMLIVLLLIILLFTAQCEINLPKPQCSDGVDNDKDSLIDYPNDPDCIGLEDNIEEVSGCCKAYSGTSFISCSDDVAQSLCSGGPWAYYFYPRQQCSSVC